MKAINIKWDIDIEDLEEGELEEILATLPTEIEIPEEIEKELEENKDAISDYISDLTGYCYYGFELDEESLDRD